MGAGTTTTIGWDHSTSRPTAEQAAVKTQAADIVVRHFEFEPLDSTVTAELLDSGLKAEQAV